jgi:RNA polymerase sigma-70 factor (ECF subfamily)
LGAVTNFLADAKDRERSQKRGGGVPALSFDFETGESHYAREPRHDDTPERIFQRRWARTLLDRVVGRLEAEFQSAGKGDVLGTIKSCLAGEGDGRYGELAQKTNLSESGVKSAVRRMRQRYRTLLRAEVMSTVADPAETDDELRFLLQAISVHGRNTE